MTRLEKQLEFIKELKKLKVIIGRIELSCQIDSNIVLSTHGMSS